MTVQGSLKASLCLVLSCSGIQDSRYRLVLPCTEKSMKSLETVQWCLYKDIPAYTSTYWYEPVHSIYTVLIPLCTIMYCYVPAHTLLGTKLLIIVLSRYKAVQGSTLESCIPEQDSTRQFDSLTLPCTVLFRYTGFKVPPCTTLYREEDEKSRNGTRMFV